MSAAGRIVIEGIGAVGGFGCGVAPSALALARRAPDAPPRLPTVHAGCGPVEIPAFRADAFLDRRALRRIDTISRLSILGAYLALRDADVERGDGVTKIALATGYRALRHDARLPRLRSSRAGPLLLPDALLLVGPRRTGGEPLHPPRRDQPEPHRRPSSRCPPPPRCSARPSGWKKAHRPVLIGGVDEYGPVLGYCWRRFFGEPTRRRASRSTPGAERPPGEGCTFLLLERPTGALRGVRRDGADRPRRERGREHPRRPAPRPRRRRSRRCAAPTSGSSPGTPSPPSAISRGLPDGDSLRRRGGGPCCSGRPRARTAAGTDHRPPGACPPPASRYPRAGIGCCAVRSREYALHAVVEGHEAAPRRRHARRGLRARAGPCSGGGTEPTRAGLAVSCGASYDPLGVDFCLLTGILLLDYDRVWWRGRPNPALQGRGEPRGDHRAGDRLMTSANMIAHFYYPGTSAGACARTSAAGSASSTPTPRSRGRG